ncbi:PDPR [Bugula neritina]|uniref:PDPR n=1 Tax=Bugula neritina TaxID=10212 RepID=A0A7J7JY53_BUGNE|nr:PDPR [Bugula neritina]
MYSCQRVAALIKRSPLPKHVLPCITSQGYCDTSNNGNVAASRKKLPYHSRVVVCGGGIVGCSIAYHLTMMGEDDVVVLEKNRIGEGATSYSAGIVGQLKSTAFETRAIQYTIELYKSLSEEHGLNWVKSGALFLARTPDRLHKLERHHQTARYIGTETQLLCKDEMAEKYPYIGGDDLLGSLWIPEDIIVHSQQITPLLRKLAEQNGATFIEDCSLLSVHTDKHRRVVTSLDTSEGEIKCDYFINAAGQWARMVGKLSTPRVRVPIHSVEHYYMLAQPQDVIDENMPVIRDYDNHCYFRMWGNSIMAGAFEAVAKPIFHDGVPETFNCAKDRLKEDWDQLQFTLDKVCKLHTTAVVCLYKGCGYRHRGFLS